MYRRFILSAVLVFPVVISAGAQELAGNNTSLLQNDSLARVIFRKISQNSLLGGAPVVNVGELTKKSYNTWSLTDVQGYVGSYNGNSPWGMDEKLILVDGAPRNIDHIPPTEISQITFLKGAQAMVLYGNRAAKGVIMITTKRGKSTDLQVDIRANTGFYIVKSCPEYLGSAEYMILYNEACADDGLGAFYSAGDIYHCGSGEDPYRYTNVNMYSSDYIREAYNRPDVTAGTSGDNHYAHFYTNIDYFRSNDVFKIGEAKHNGTSGLNIRSSVNSTLSDFITACVNAKVSFHSRRSANGSYYWSAASTLRPNRISPLVPLSYIDANAANAWDLVVSGNNIVDGERFLTGTQSDMTSVFDDYYTSGYSEAADRLFQFDAGVNIGLDKVLKGLPFHTRFSVDYSATYITSCNNSYATYAPTQSSNGGKDIIVGLTKYNENKKSGVQNISDGSGNQTVLFSDQFGYEDAFNNGHHLATMLITSGYQQSYSGEYHKTSNVNLDVRLGYNLRNKCYTDSGRAVIHSAKLTLGYRGAFLPFLTLGQKLSNESFLGNSLVVGELMLGVSGSILNTDLGINSYYMYGDYYSQSDSTWWGWRESVSLHFTNSRQEANEDLSFIRRKELSANLKTSLWNRMIAADAPFFVNSIEGKIVTSATQYPEYFFIYYPTASFRPYINYDNDHHMGFDFSVDYNKRFGKVDFTAGVTGAYYTTKAIRRDGLYQDEYQYHKGYAVDGTWGLQCIGFFEDEQDIIDSSEQRLGGTIRPSDLKYIDQNNGGIIDDKDQVYLARGGWYGTPLALGINLVVKWKGLTFFVLGTGEFSGHTMRNNESCYWISGEGKCSAIVRGRWTPEATATTTYPRLTTESGINNLYSSDFWMCKTDAFHLAKVQVTYDLPSRWFKNSFVHGVSAYISGSDLLTISKERKALELNVDSNPQRRFYNLGMTAAF